MGIGHLVKMRTLGRGPRTHRHRGDLPRNARWAT